MNKPKHLSVGDKVAIISLSSGILGEAFAKHELELGEKRVKEWGLVPVYMNNALKGMNFLKNHPEARADDLKHAFADPEIKGIICAIGGIDTFRTYPYLLEDETFKQNVKNNPKIFMGFSDTTANHLMFQKLGLNTFYGPAFLTDFAEFEDEMLPYTKESIKYLFNSNNTYEIKCSDVWYKDRTDYSPNAVGTKRECFAETKGYEVLQGTKSAQGKLLGGCIDVMAHLIGIFSPAHEENIELIGEQNAINEKYNIFPSLDEWAGKIMFFETSEEKMPPSHFEKIIKVFKQRGIFGVINGLVVGKPIDEVYYEEYKQILKQELAEYDIPVMFNFNFGHSYPRTIIPYGTEALLDPINKTFTLIQSSLN